MIIRVQSTELSSVQRFVLRLIREWGPGPDRIGGLALLECPLPRPRRRSGTTADLLVWTPRGCTLVVLADFASVQHGVLHTPPGGRWQVDDREADLRTGSATANPLLRARRQRSELVGILRRHGLSEQIDILVVLIPKTGSRISWTPPPPESGEETILVRIGRSGGLGEYFGRPADAGIRWRAADIARAFEVLGVSRSAPDPDELVAEGFPADSVHAPVPPPIDPTTGERPGFGRFGVGRSLRRRVAGAPSAADAVVEPGSESPAAPDRSDEPVPVGAPAEEPSPEPAPPPVPALLKELAGSGGRPEPSGERHAATTRSARNRPPVRSVPPVDRGKPVEVGMAAGWPAAAGDGSPMGGSESVSAAPPAGGPAGAGRRDEPDGDMPAPLVEPGRASTAGRPETESGTIRAEYRARDRGSTARPELPTDRPVTGDDLAAVEKEAALAPAPGPGDADAATPGRNPGVPVDRRAATSARIRRGISEWTRRAGSGRRNPGPAGRPAVRLRGPGERRTGRGARSVIAVGAAGVALAAVAATVFAASGFARFDVAEYGALCAGGGGIEAAAPYSVAGPSPVYLAGDLSVDTAFGPSAVWHPIDARSVQLVACVSEVRLGSLVRTCQYPPGPDRPVGRTLNLFTVVHRITVYEARTGNRLAAIDLTGEQFAAEPGMSDPDPCAAAAGAPEDGLPGRRHSGLSHSQVRDALTPFVHPAEAPIRAAR
ncbi:hypothetical protein [Nocardia sp. NPDC024068]|uniref:hypothetical protein n=1 Tax=Nocardia sp. NPDC024068 TaxID=3157197 RepID=UPI0033E3E75C